MKTIQPGMRLGNIRVPASKSYSQRVLLAAALCYGETIVSNVGKSADDDAMLQFIQFLGANVNFNDALAKINRLNDFPQRINVNAGESALGIRLITCVLAALGGRHEISGKGSLRTRPMQEFENIFENHGIQIKTSNGAVPIQIEGKLLAGEYFIDGSMSSQFVSGMLMALPLLENTSILHVSNLNSLPYVKITLDVLETFGVFVSHSNYSDFEIKGNQVYQPAEIEIENDWSSAAGWLVASALGHDIQVCGLNPSSLQADKRILVALENAGSTIWENEGVFSCSEAKSAFSFDATDAPDLFPVLVALASFMDGKSTIVGVERLAHKESNRALVLQEEFGKLGVKIELEGDLMHIFGQNQLFGGQVSSHNDHRIAMALAIAGLRAESNTIIEQPEAIKKSYPQFWEHIDGLTLEEA